MQSCNDFPPPPAVLAAVSDGLELEPDEDGSVSLRPLPPEVRVVVVTGGGSGVMPCSWGPGVPMTDVGTVVGVGGAAMGGVIFTCGELELAAAAVEGTATVDVDCGEPWVACVFPGRVTAFEGS